MRPDRTAAGGDGDDLGEGRLTGNAGGTRSTRTMKVNFWQVLGLVLIIIGVVLFFRDKTSTTDVKPPDNAVPQQPSPPPATTQSAP